MEISAYVINLPERVDRHSEMQKQLKVIDWTAEFQVAMRPLSSEGFPSTGARGCFLSHLAALKRALSNNTHVLIIEDDLNFVSGFRSKWDHAYGQLQQADWSIFYPGHTLAETSIGLETIAPSKGIQCSHFILFNSSVVPAIINGLETILSRLPGHFLGGPMHVDGAYSTIRAQNPDLITYANFPPLGYQRSSRSDIADHKLIDRIEILSPIISRLRGIKQRLKR